MKLKKGDIVLNRWAGMVEARYFIYTGTSGRMVKGIQVGNGKIHKVEYYKTSLDENLHDGKPALEIVGKTTAFDVMLQELRFFQQKESEDK